MENLLAECGIRYEPEHGKSRNNREFSVMAKYSKYCSQNTKYYKYLWNSTGLLHRNRYRMVVLPTWHVPLRLSFNLLKAKRRLF